MKKLELQQIIKEVIKEAVLSLTIQGVPENVLKMLNSINNYCQENKCGRITIEQYPNKPVWKIIVKKRYLVTFHALRNQWSVVDTKEKKVHDIRKSNHHRETLDNIIKVIKW
jgi:hypothetical protein